MKPISKKDLEDYEGYVLDVTKWKTDSNVGVYYKENGHLPDILYVREFDIERGWGFIAVSKSFTLTDEEFRVMILPRII
jgi:hypothetical protein